jgi:hypothetical protein
MAQGGPCFAIFDQRIFDVTAAEEEREKEKKQQTADCATLPNPRSAFPLMRPQP